MTQQLKERSGSVWRKFAAVMTMMVIVLLGGGATHALAVQAPEDINPATRVYQFDLPRDTMTVTGPSASTDEPFPSGNVYCTRSYQQPGCIKKGLVVRVVYMGCTAEGGSGEIYIVNPNQVRAPRDLMFFRQMEPYGAYLPFFGDRWWAEPGKNPVQGFQKMPDGTYMVGGGWEDQVLAFGGNTFTIDCGVSNPSTPGS